MLVAMWLQVLKNWREPVGTASKTAKYSLGVTGTPNFSINSECDSHTTFLFSNWLTHKFPLSNHELYNSDLFLYNMALLFQIKYLCGLKLCWHSKVQAKKELACGGGSVWLGFWWNHSRCCWNLFFFLKFYNPLNFKIVIEAI